MVIYNALPRKKYERIFMCSTTKEIWKNLLITHQGNNQVKDNKIDHLVQQYEQFVNSEDEFIDSAFPRFNTIITILKALDEGYSSKNYVRKFLRALHPKWRAKVTAIEESKDLTSLSLDELIGNLKVHKMIIKKDSKIVKAKVKRKYLALKAKKESSDEECLTYGSEDEEYAMATFPRSRDNKNGKSDRKCFRCGDPNHLIGECPKPPRDKYQRSFVGGSWSDSGEENDEKIQDETCLVAQAPNEIITKNKKLKAIRNSLENELRELEESKDLTSLSFDELIGNLKVHEMIIKKDSKIVKEKVERTSIALKTKKESRDEECSTSGSEDEEYGDPNHLIGECTKPPKDKNQRAFVGGSWSDSGEEDYEKVKDETCLVAHASSEVCSESSYFSDEKSSIGDLALDNEYDKLCKMSLKIITKKIRLKATRNSLENELRELKDKLSILEKNKGVDLDCAKCHALKIENEKLKEESTRLNKFKKITHCLNEMLSNQKPFGDKLGLGFNSFEASSIGTKEIKFVKAQKNASSDGGAINMGGPQSVKAAPKIIMGPPLATSGSEKTVSFQKFILGHRPKHIIVNKVKVSVASDNEVKIFYKPLSKPRVGFSKPNLRSKTPLLEESIIIIVVLKHRNQKDMLVDKTNLIAFP
nr:zf-CCHC domain-containing protein/DUF4219 domain-containing protein/UBN2 domain-containing protein [Tanacetum cinerariifolium]